jgi:hypothetical protein
VRGRPAQLPLGAGVRRAALPRRERDRERPGRDARHEPRRAERLLGTGSSSTTLRIPAAPDPTAETVASAASSTWMNEDTPSPSPTIG